MCLDELSACFLESSVAVIVVRSVESWVQPERLGVWNFGQVTWLLVDDYGLLAFDGTNEQALVLLQDFVAMEIVESLGGILTCDLAKHNFATRVGIYEIGNIVDLVVDNDPEVVFGGVLQ